MPRQAYLQISDENRSLLLRDVVVGAESSSVGFEDAEQTLEQRVRQLKQAHHLPVSAIEAALWSSNLLHELGEWNHPGGLEFDAWINELLGPKLEFDRFWNLIEEKNHA